MATESLKRPDVIDWGIFGENSALRQINTGDSVDLERYWETNQSVGAGLMVDDIETPEEMIENAKVNGRMRGFTFAISSISGEETGEFQGFVQLTLDTENELRNKIERTALFRFSKDVVIWEISYAKYPPAAPHQVVSAVRQACVLLLRKVKLRGCYPRVAIIGSSNPVENPPSLKVLASACFDPIGTTKERPEGIIQYDEHSEGLDSIWLLNWNTLHCKLREKAAPHFERNLKTV